MDVKKTGAFIAELRKEQGITQKQLAERLLVSDKAVSRWETGHGMPDIDNLEALSQALDASVAELLRGERIDDAVEPEEVAELAADSLTLVRQLLGRRTVGNVVLGFLAGLAVITLLVVHLASPIQLVYREGMARVDELADGTLVVVAETGASGIDVERVEDADGEGPLVFVSFHTSRLSQLAGTDTGAVAALGDKDSVETVLYYPGTPDDVVLYSSGEPRSGGTMTLPRLVYNYWILLSAAAGIVGLVAYALLRGKWFAGRILRAALFPICLSLSLLAVLWNRFGEVYNARFYLSGIMLMALVLYAIALLVLARLPRKA